jgi:hypothetical protein
MSHYVLELHLTNGEIVSTVISEDDVAKLVASGRFIWPRDLAENERPFSAIYTVTIEAMEKGSGIFVATDDKNRVWAIPNRNIYAFNLIDTTSAKAPRSLGFDTAYKDRLTRQT